MRANRSAPQRTAARVYARWRRHEGPTWMVVGAVHGTWIALTLSAAALPWWLVAAALAVVLAWHNSLQHEAVHGHPTPSRRVNACIASLPLGLWMPFASYRRLHLEHHRVTLLTDPERDPESYYLTAARWRALPAPAAALLTFNNCLLGRLTIGPLLAAGCYWFAEARAATTGDRGRVLREWGPHLALVAGLLAWLSLVCALPLWLYALAAYGGLALTLIRSFAEHHPAAGQEARTATVEASLFWRLLFLGNNYHVLHHRRPALPWYRLISAYRRQREGRDRSEMVFDGYSDLFRRYILRPKDSPLHPSAAAGGAD